MADLKLQVLLSMLDKVTAPLRRINAASKASGDTLRKTREALRAMDKTQQAVGEFRNLKEGTRATALRQRELQQQLAATAREMRATDAPSAALERQFRKLTKEARGLKAQETAQTEKLQQLREHLAAAGIGTASLGTGERKLRSDMAATTASMEQQTAALRKQGEQMKRVQGLRESLSKTQALSAHLSVAGYASLQGGRHLVGAVAPMIDQGKQYQQHIAQMRAQGASASDLALAERFAATDTTRGNSITDKLEIVKDANSIFRDMREAVAVAPQLLKAKYTFEALMAQNGQGEGHGGEVVNELIDAIRTGELRNATTSPDAFKQLLDTMTRAYVGSGGLVKPSDYLHTMKVGGVATKQMDEKALFFGAMHTIQEMGGMRAGTGFATAYQNWATGRSTQQSAEALAALGLVNKDAVKYGKNGHITKMLPGALVNQQLYETNPFDYMMKEVIPRINPTGKLNDDQVVSKLNALFSGRKGGDLFAGMYMQRANIEKQLRASAHFASLDQAYQQTGATAQGEETDLLAKKRDLYLQLGTQLLPVYVSALEKVVAVTGAITRWAKAHPALAKAITVTAAAVGVLMVGAGGLMVALGGILGPLGVIRFALGMSSGGALGLSKALGGGLVRGIKLAGNVFIWLGRALMANPILLIISLIAGAAYLIWKHWDKIKPYLLKFWNWIADIAGNVWAWIKESVATTVAVFKAVWDTLKGWFIGLWEAIKAPWIAGFAWIKESVATAVAVFKATWDTLKGWFSDLWEAIKAPWIAGFAWISDSVAATVAAFKAVWDTLKGWFSDLWEAIKAPFVAGFAWIDQKLDEAIATWQKIKKALTTDSTVSAVLSVAKDSKQSASTRAGAVLLAGLAMANPVAALAFDAAAGKPKVTAQAPLRAGGGGNTTTNQYTVHVTAAAGREQDAARAASAELDRRERAKAAQRRSSLTDHE